MQLLYLNPEQIELDPQGVREDAGEVGNLAETIREQGLLQPLGVLPLGRDRFRVVYGGRRLRAARELGLERLPCIVLEPESSDALVQQLVENIQRLELNDLEKARSFARLRERIHATGDGRPPNEGQTEEQIGQLVGLAPRTIRRYLGLLDLEPEVQQLLRSGELSVTQAQHLRRLTPRTQVELAQMIAEEGLSAAEVSNLAAYFVANPDLSVDAAMQALANNLELRSEAPAPATGGGPLAKGGAPETGERDDDLWDDDDSAADDEAPFGSSTFEAAEASRNKARVFRIRSLDQMVDEADRLARAYHEGDLQRWASEDDSSALKLRLLLKQLRSLTQALEALVGTVEIEH